jgi:hypothetical protein
MQVTPHVHIGKKQVKLDTPSHVPGVAEGNGPYRAKEQKRGRSTGIDPKGHEPIDPSMPKLTPA